jgi:predicted dehydrogenase
MEKIGLAIIGSGQISLQNHLPGFALIPQVEVLAHCDNNPAVLQKAAQQTGIKLAFTDYREMLARPEVDAVVVATPNFWHGPQVLSGSNTGTVYP